MKLSEALNVVGIQRVLTACGYVPPFNVDIGFERIEEMQTRFFTGRYTCVQCIVLFRNLCGMQSQAPRNPYYNEKR